MREDQRGGLGLEEPPLKNEPSVPAGKKPAETLPSRGEATGTSEPREKVSSLPPRPPRFRRRRYFVNPRIQGPLLLHALGYSFFFMVLMAFGIFSPLVSQLDGTPVNQPNPFWSPAYSLLYLHTHFWPLDIGGLLLIAIHSIFSSHRMAGPLFRLSALFRSMKEGEIPTRQVIRKRDFLHPEFEEFNAMVAAWKDRIEKAKRQVQRLEKQAGLLQEEALLSDSPSLLDLVQSITETRKKLAEELEWFREKV